MVALDFLFDKSVASERRRIEELLATYEARVRRAFTEYITRATSESMLRQVRQALERREVSVALEIVAGHAVAMGDVITSIFIDVARDEVSALARQVANSRISLSFDPSAPRAAAVMRQSRLSFIQEFTDAQRQAVRRVLVAALETGIGPLEAARAFKGAIGLTSYQLDAVDNYRRLLEQGDARALQRMLRDARFDRSVLRAIHEGWAIDPERIARMVERYRQRMLAWRAEVIARTETIRVLNRARTEALAQVVEQAAIPTDAVRRTWRSTRDSRVRDTHAQMDGQKRGMHEPFISPSGARMMFPGDGGLGAPASELINCRCVLMVKVSGGAT